MSAPTAPTRTEAPAIHARGLAHSFGDVVALRPGLDVDVPAGGGVVGLLGPNGSGKSTLMRLLTGLIPLQQGEIEVAGVRLEGDGLDVRRRVTYAPGELHLYTELTGAAHLRFLLRGRGRDAVRRAEQTAHELGLPLGARVRGYSHGMKRQLVFCAAIAPDVPVRILDEISEGLDPSKRSQILDRIEADAASGTTILLSSHHLGEVERACERIVFLNGGAVIADESTDELKDRAARILRLEYASEDDAAWALGAAERFGVESAGTDGAGTVRLVLRSADPRGFLAALGSDTDGPAPLGVLSGQVSLSELYATLYGVEGT